MRPPPSLIMSRAPACVQRNVPFTLTSYIAASVSSGVSSRYFCAPTPAVLIRMPAGPNALRASANIASTCSGRRMSAWQATALPPAATILSRTPCAPASSTSATTTAAPSAASRAAVAAPMPFPPPVTTATLPVNRGIC